jgi:hypothetical protein
MVVGFSFPIKASSQKQTLSACPVRIYAIRNRNSFPPVNLSAYHPEFISASFSPYASVPKGFFLFKKDSIPGCAEFEPGLT